MAIFEPLPVPVIENLDPNYFEAFVGLRVQQFTRAADFLEGPAIEISDLAQGDIEAATDAAWFAAASEAEGLDAAIDVEDLTLAVLAGGALDLEVEQQQAEPSLDPGPGANETDLRDAETTLKGGSLAGTLAGLEAAARSLNNRP